MKKLLSLLLSVIFALSCFLGYSSNSKAMDLERKFNPNDFSTYGLGLKEGTIRKDLKPYVPSQKFVSMQEKRKFGQKQDVKVLPEKVDLRQFFPPARNQYRFSTCVPFAAAGLREYYIAKNTTARGDNINYLSPLYLYYPAGPDDGMHIDSAFYTMQNRGVAPEEERPYDSNKENRQQFSEPLTKEQNKSAVPYKIRDYNYISKQDMVEKIKKALANGDPVLVPVHVYPNFDATPNTGIVPPVGEKKSRGGHALVVVGYDEDNQWFIMRNSWGDKFGDSGYVYMKYDIYMELNNGYGYVAVPYSRQKYPPQGVKLTLSSSTNHSNTFQVTGIDAQKYELYRDNHFVRAFRNNVVTDSGIETSKSYKYYVVARNKNGFTKSKSIEIKAVEGTLDKAS